MAKPYSDNGTRWYIDLNRRAVQEQRKDGTVITHIRPSGGKSIIGCAGLKYLAIKQVKAPADKITDKEE